jgi:hypothetical protein
MGTLISKPRVRTIIRSGIWGLERSHNLPVHVRRAVRRIFKCKTPALGRHVQVCENGHRHSRWNSCRHRACPECSWPAKKRWLTKTEGRLLACAHHHFVFTFADEQLNALWLANVPAMERLIFASAKQTLMKLFADRYHGSKPGVIAVLHTWGRSLALHPHLHMIVTRGGVDASGVWHGPKRHHKAVLPAKVVSRLFRGKLLAAVRKELDAGRLALPDGVDIATMKLRIAEAYEMNWSVFIGHAGTQLQTIVNYLGRYICGGPIGNSRIIDIKDGVARFMHRDYRVTGPNGLPLERPMALPQKEFLRRWCLHVPLPHSKNVRSFGLYAPAYKGPAARPPMRRRQPEPPDEAPMPSRDIFRCPDCGAEMKLRHIELPDFTRAPPLGRLG